MKSEPLEQTSAATMVTAENVKVFLPRVVSVNIDFDQLFETAPNPYLVLLSDDPDFTIAAVNDAYLRATRTCREDIVGRGLFEVFPDNPNDPTADGVRHLHASLQRALDSRAPDRMDLQKYDISRPASEGGGFEERYWRPLNTPVVGSDGEVTAIIHHVEDVTERVRAEESLTLAAGAAEVGVWDFNLKTDVMTWCHRTKRMFGISPDVQCSMDSFYGGLHPEDRDATSEALALALDPARRATYDVEYRTIGKEDGIVRWIAAKGKGIFDTSGSCLRVIGTAIDITDRKKIDERLLKSEADLREMNATLEVRVAERTAELKEAQGVLRQAQKMEAVGQLTGGIAHDFNNMLAGIVGGLDMIGRRLKQGRHENLESYIDMAMSSANRAAALTHRLLAFARRQPLDPKVVDVNPLIEGMDDLLRRTIDVAIELRLALDPDAWTTLCDPFQLENAILNLAINARDAMPLGGSLVVSTRNKTVVGSERSASCEYVVISVADTGTGMPPDVVARAFDPFFTTKPLGKGTGLGLSMIYGFAKQSEGDAVIDSVAGKGTTISLFLPRYHGEATVADSVKQGVDAPSGRGETILLVEDEAAVRSLVQEVLDEAGYRVVLARDGNEGLVVARAERRIDMLITDVGLPGLNGRQLADALRVSRPRLKVLFITGYAEAAASPAGALEPGMSMVIKPFVLDTLVSRVRELLDAA